MLYQHQYQCQCQQPETMLEQYDVTVGQITKGRGLFLCETGQGLKALVPFGGSAERAAAVSEALFALQESGYPAEQVMRTQEGAYLVEDENGTRYWLRDHVSGSECQTAKSADAFAAAEVLARFHTAGKACVPTPADCMRNSRSEPTELYRRHYRELVSVKNFVNSRRAKNEFERCFWQQYPYYIAQAKEALTLLDTGEKPQLLHGDCNQHNLLHTKQGLRLVNFESMCSGQPVTDLANLMRKLLEKNGWEPALGEGMLAAYERERALDDGERRLLYGLLLFPEKFWKLANHYSNSHKAWVSKRDIEKLGRLTEAEEARRIFLKKMVSFL